VLAWLALELCDKHFNELLESLPSEDLLVGPPIDLSVLLLERRKEWTPVSTLVHPSSTPLAPMATPLCLTSSNKDLVLGTELDVRLSSDPYESEATPSSHN